VSKPVTHNDLEDSGEETLSPADAVVRLSQGLVEAKASLMADDRFIGNLFRQIVSNEQTNFPHEGTKGVENLIYRHSLKGRTKKVRINIYLSEQEWHELNELRKERRNRSIGDFVNELICRALAAIRAL